MWKLVEHDIFGSILTDIITELRKPGTDLLTRVEAVVMPMCHSTSCGQCPLGQPNTDTCLGIFHGIRDNNIEDSLKLAEYALHIYRNMAEGIGIRECQPQLSRLWINYPNM